MKEHSWELKARVEEADGESAVLEAIADMQESDRAMAGKVVCFFQPAQKFKTRYSTLDFNDPAHLDEGALWPVAYALKELTTTEEATISALVKKAAG